MGWYAEVTFLLLVRYTASATELLHSNLPQSLNDEDVDPNLVNIGEDDLSFVNQYEDAKLEHLGKMLANVLIQPWPRGLSPLVYVENAPPEYFQGDETVESDPVDVEENANIPFKRSRYYRKYPWKRQNSRYDAENRYLCQPSKEDVFRLLVALHEARQGNRGQMISFCNRRRPASAIFTNIRFLG
ncbi:hypothetical protein Zmor_014815 [Zophobas morio]|uniref:Uncharacterized protein n=2 Tax=Zophobas TaxID=7073 RepID=A0AA38ILJ1_9CUCU|nr:hypothetical protein Zmor_014815 [Zophobas morio]UXO98094.1 RFLamide [Zophobas atratus]